MRQEMHRVMAELEEHHWWFTGTRRVIFAELERAQAELPGHRGRLQRILDLGCGTGFTTQQLSLRGWVAGVDFSAYALRQTRQRAPSAAPLQASAVALPLRDEVFDLVCAFDVVEHVADDLTALREIRRVLRPGGLLLLTAPAWPWLWSEHDEAVGHQRRYTAATLRARLVEARLVVRRETYYNTLLFPLAAGYRLVLRALRSAAGKGRGGEPPSTDLAPMPEPYNRWLGELLASERHLLRRGDLPFGLSLLVVAERARG